MFDTSKIPTINSNVQAILHDVGAGHTSFDRTHANDANVLLKYGVIVWSGANAAMGHDAANVLQQVGSVASNLDRKHAEAAGKAMAGGTLAIVAG